ncbi:hypothetical protein GOODEAATRI_002257, partial [Goodea atripinnis]
DKQLSSFDISLRFTHLFWLGDLNYRLDMDIQVNHNKIHMITCSLPKSSEQAYIEFESVEAIVKTASRTKFFIEFYSTCLEEFKKSYENDSQSSDNVNFLRVGWTSKQLTTLKPLLSEIEYLQDQHLLLTVKSVDGYESYEWISVDQDETGGPKGKSTMVSRAGHEYVRPKQDTPDGDSSIGKNSFNNPAYYILEGVPHPSAAALSPELLPSSTSPTSPAVKAPPPSAGARTKPPPATSGLTHCHRGVAGHLARGISEESSSEDDGGAALAVAQGGGVAGIVGNSLNRPPPDFPPPPLPKGALETVAEAQFSKPRSLYPDLAEVKIPSAGPGGPLGLGEGFRRGGGGALDDQSCSVLQMAKTLSESEFPGQPPRAPSAPPPVRVPPIGILDACRTFPPRNPIPESIAEDMPEEALWGSSSSSLSVGESSVGEWLQRLGLEKYEEGLLHNGWDDLEFLR